MTNAIEHATGASTVEIRLELSAAGEIEGTVTDHGQWRHAEQKMPLTVDAAPGSPAAIVLSLVALLDHGYPQGESWLSDHLGTVAG